MESIKQRQAKLVEEFSEINSWEDRYKKIIQLGKELPSFGDEIHQDKFLVKGCQSRVWLQASLDSDEQMVLQADSDALIVKGLAALLLRVYSPAAPEDVRQSPPDFIKDLGFANYLSPSRANGFLSMVKQIMLYATVLEATLK